MSNSVTDYELAAAFSRRMQRKLMEAIADTDPALCIEELREIIRNGRGMTKVAAIQTMLKLIQPSLDESVQRQLDSMTTEVIELRRYTLNNPQPHLIEDNSNGSVEPYEEVDRGNGGGGTGGESDHPETGKPPDPA